jgi:GT2 family glycosyltransferase
MTNSQAMLQPPDVAVIIVNYGTADLAILAVESVLQRGHAGLSVEVHLVDNASPGNDAAVLSQAATGWGDRVTFYPEDTNHGFGRGNNLVLKELWRRKDRPGKAYLLNPDARLETNVIAELAAFMDDHPRVAVVGSGIDRPEDGAPLACAFRFPSLTSEVVGAIGFGPLARLFSASEVPLSPESPTMPVDWVAGASMMVRLEALADVGFFDPDYFLYYEEVDLMLRLKRKGWEIWHCAEARIAHVAGAATGVHGKDPRPRRRPGYWYDSWRIYFTKNHGRAYAIMTGLGMIAGSALGDLIDRLRGRQPRSPERLRGDLWRRGLLPLLVTGRSDMSR